MQANACLRSPGNHHQAWLNSTQIKKIKIKKYPLKQKKTEGKRGTK